MARRRGRRPGPPAPAPSIAVLVGADLTDALAAAPDGGARASPPRSSPRSTRPPSPLHGVPPARAAASPAPSWPRSSASATRRRAAARRRRDRRGAGAHARPARREPPRVTVGRVRRRPVAARGVELLHGVAMEVTVELGRTRMSVRELLALCPGRRPRARPRRRQPGGPAGQRPAHRPRRGRRRRRGLRPAGHRDRRPAAARADRAGARRPRRLSASAVVLGLFWRSPGSGRARSAAATARWCGCAAGQALSRGSSLAVVEVGSRVLVVGVSDAGVRLLTELDPFELETDVSDLTELPGRGSARRVRPPAPTPPRCPARAAARPAAGSPRAPRPARPRTPPPSAARCSPPPPGSRPGPPPPAAGRRRHPRCRSAGSPE